MTTSSTPMPPLQTAVLFLVFNRPDNTAQVFEAIRQARPLRLYVAADGPREGREGEAEIVTRVREIATAVDWRCDIKTLFRGKNLGCKHSVSGAINWFFEQEQQGIILEDDCLPHPDFFSFCETLLKLYSDDERVSVITGNNFQNGRWRGDASYYFSKYNHCWGWASWRRAWKYYDGELSFWPNWCASDTWSRLHSNKVERRYWERIFNRVREGQIDSWAYPWTASVWFNGGLTATPNVNLVSNIGFGPGSTHTTAANSPLANMATNAVGELSHPVFIAQNQAADQYVFEHTFGGKNQRFPWFLLRLPRRACAFVYRKIKGIFT
jgi:GR25 family glycosyltransferase involved in LPS biosynthesis